MNKLKQIIKEETDSWSKSNITLGDTFDIQDATAERTISEKDLWGDAGVWRYKIENAGDILRELSSRGHRPDPVYLEEKVNEIERWLRIKIKMEMPDDLTNLSDFNKTNLRFSQLVDSREYLERFYGNILNKTIKEYENIPVYTKEQQIAKDLVLNLLNNNIPELKTNLKQIRLMIDEIKNNNRLIFTPL